MVVFMSKNKRLRKEIPVEYVYNDKNQPERLNRVFDMLFAKVTNTLKQNHEDSQA